MSTAQGINEGGTATQADVASGNGRPAAQQEKITIIVHSGDFDKMYSAFIIGNGALAMGMEASMYFTFWGLSRLKRGKLASGPLSKMHMLGLGKLMVQSRMRKQNVRPLDQLARDFKELGGRIFACDMTMDIMGIKAEQLEQELIEEYCAVGTYIREARESKVTLFI
jgi:peroxiredoxin family protein